MLDFSCHQTFLKRDMSVNGVTYPKGMKIHFFSGNILGIRKIYVEEIPAIHTPFLFKVRYIDAYRIIEGFNMYDGNDTISPCGNKCHWRGEYNGYYDFMCIPAWGHVKIGEWVNLKRTGDPLE